jgi:hypothetical protein
MVFSNSFAVLWLTQRESHRPRLGEIRRTGVFTVLQATPMDGENHRASARPP